MNMDCFLKRYLSVLMNDKDDDTFKAIQMLTGGTTSVRISKLLNLAVSQMDAKECYVEVGVFCGTTLCSAGYTNDRPCFGIDPYKSEDMAQMTGMTSDFIHNRALHNINCMSSGKTKIIRKDFRDVKHEELGNLPIAVSFIDGKHDFTSVMENFYWMEPMMADDAIIVLDDINYIEVSLAIEKWMGLKAQNFDLMCYIKPYYSEDHKNIWSVGDRFMNNGVAVIRYHRGNTFNTLSYDPEKAAWSLEEMEKGIKNVN